MSCYLRILTFAFIISGCVNRNWHASSGADPDAYDKCEASANAYYSNNDLGVTTGRLRVFNACMYAAGYVYSKDEPIK